MNEDSNLTFNADYAAWYDTVNQHKPYAQEIEFLDRWLSRLGAKEDLKILDVGCGTGTHALGLYDRGYRVQGVDLSPHMIRVAKSKNKKVPFFASPLEDFSESEFDACYSMGQVVNNLPHFDALGHFFKNILQLLKKGGGYYFEVWNPLSLIETPPLPLTRYFETPEYNITRHARPTCRFLEQELTLEYEIQIQEKYGKITNKFKVLSDSKLFTAQEILYFLKKAGFHEIQMHPAIVELSPLTSSNRFLSFLAGK